MNSHDAIRSRFDQIQRENRQIKRGLLAIVVVAGGIGLTAAAAPRTTVLDTEKLVIRDETGKERCRIEAGSQHGVIQTFLDAKGVERIRLVVDQDGIARIRLFDESGTTRVGAYTFPASFKDAPEAAGIAILGHGNQGATSEKGGIFLRTTKEGMVDQDIYDRNGKNRIRLATETSGDALLSLADAKGEGKEGVLLATTPNGFAFQQLSGHDGKRRYLVSTNPDGATDQYFFDGNDTARIALGLTAKNMASANFNGHDGKSRIRTLVVPPGSAADGIAAQGFAAQLFFDDKGTLRVDTSIYADRRAGTDYRDAEGNLRLADVVLPDGNAYQGHYDARNQLRCLTSTATNGEAGVAFFGRDGVTKASTMVQRDNAVSQYIEQDAATRAWNGYRNTRDVIQAAEDVFSIIDFLRPKNN